MSCLYLRVGVLCFFGVWFAAASHPLTNTITTPTIKQALCETLGGQGAGCEWWEPYALSLLRRVLSSYKGAKAIVAAADKVKGVGGGWWGASGKK